jgi:hypothetical protein
MSIFDARRWSEESFLDLLFTLQAESDWTSHDTRQTPQIDKNVGLMMIGGSGALGG